MMSMLALTLQVGLRWAKASDLLVGSEAAPYLGNSLRLISPLEQETPLLWGLVFQDFVISPHLFANKRWGEGLSAFSSPSPACFLSRSPRADAVNWSILKVHINTQRAKETSWQRNIIITS